MNLERIDLFSFAGFLVSMFLGILLALLSFVYHG